MLQVSMVTVKPLKATMVKHLKAIIMNLQMVTTIMTHKAIAMKLHKATTGAMMRLIMSVKNLIKNKAIATTAMMPMDCLPMALVPIPPMTTGNTMPSITQGKTLPMVMTTIQGITMKKMVMKKLMEGDTAMRNHIIVTVNQ